MRQAVYHHAVFVTDGHQRSALAVVRALGRAGIPVTVGEMRAESLAGSSRYCTKQVRYPSPYEDSTGFQQFLREELKGEAYGMLIPMTDVSSLLVAQMRGSFKPGLAIPIPTEEAIHRSQDKGHMVELAQRLGIPCPRTLSFSSSENRQQLARIMQFPVVIKHRFSHFCQRGRWLSSHVRYANSQQELTLESGEMDREIPGVLVQEKLSGEGRGVFLLVWDGDLKAAFCHRRLREKPPSGGVSVYRESIPLNESLVEKSLKLLRELNWQGVAMVEFKVDGRDGEAKLMEVNGRFWGSLQLAIDAGMNFPLLLYRLAAGENVPSQFDYKAGVKSRWLLGDLDHLLIRLAHSNRSNGFSSQPAPKLRVCMDFMKFFEPNLHYEVCRLEDPRPGWFEFKSYMREIVRSLNSAEKSSTSLATEAPTR